MKYVAFSDESYKTERYRSIATFSCKESHAGSVDSKLKVLLKESSANEFKWNKLKDAKYRLCSLKLIDAVWEFIGFCDARVDVIVWDTQDSRHAIASRDDVANYGRMYFHLSSHMMKRRPKNSTWCLYPDEEVEITWEKINNCIEAVGKHREYIESPLFGDFFNDQYYVIEGIQPVKSHKTPCCQIADLFAGLTVFSRTHYDLYEKWISRDIPTLGLFNEPTYDTSNREENRFKVLEYLDSGCKKRKLGVSLKTRRYLHTPNPSNPLNFWHYEPQHDKDKAPTKDDAE